MFANLPQGRASDIQGERRICIDILRGDALIKIVRDIDDEAGGGVERRPGTLHAREVFVASGRLVEDVMVQDEKGSGPRQ